MGGTPCKIIIIEGNLTYAVVEQLADKADTIFLEAAIKASCDGTHQASIYSAITNYNIPQESTLEKIIALHNEIIIDLPLVNKKNLQDKINDLADRLFAASRELYLLNNPAPNFVPISLESVRQALGIK